MADHGNFSIRLVDERGRPLSSRGITVFYSGFMSGSEKRYTDRDGWAEFPTFGYSHTGNIYSYMLHGLLIMKRGVLLSDGERISDGATFSFVIEDG